MSYREKKNCRKSFSLSSSSTSSLSTDDTPEKRNSNRVRGYRGRRGPRGHRGHCGPRGRDGQNGQNGQNGKNGKNGTNTNALGAYGYVYALIPQTVAIDAPVLFDANGPLNNILHTPGSNAINIMNMGVYLIQFSVSGTEPNQFDIYVNGAPNLSSLHGSGAGTQQNNGSVILNLNAADVITLVSHSSTAAVTLASPVGGTQSNVTASITIVKLA
jgi:hypothetical protein